MTEPNSTPRYPVSVQRAAPRAIAAVRARMPVGQVPAKFTEHLNQVYAAAKNGAIHLDGQNIFVYRDAVGFPGDVDVDFGVGALAPFAPVGRVTYTQLPVGDVAAATHWGDYAGIGGAHAAVVEWCRANNRKRTGTLWEVYGHWTNDPARLRTDVYHLLEPSTK